MAILNTVLSIMECFFWDIEEEHTIEEISRDGQISESLWAFFVKQRLVVGMKSAHALGARWSSWHLAGRQTGGAGSRKERLWNGGRGSWRDSSLRIALSWWQGREFSRVRAWGQELAGGEGWHLESCPWGGREGSETLTPKVSVNSGSVIFFPHEVFF